MATTHKGNPTPRPRPATDISGLLDRLYEMAYSRPEAVQQHLVALAEETADHAGCWAGVSLRVMGNGSPEIHTRQRTSDTVHVLPLAETPLAGLDNSEEPLLLKEPGQQFPAFGQGMHELLLTPLGNGRVTGMLWLATANGSLPPGMAHKLKALARHGGRLLAQMPVRPGTQALAGTVDAHLVLDHLPLGILRLDRGLHCTFVNRQALAGLDGACPKIGQLPWAGFQGQAAKRLEEMLRRTAQTGTVQQMELRVPEMKHWYDVEAHPLPDGEVLIFLHDAQARKKHEHDLGTAQKAADRQRRFYTAILTTTPDFAYVWGADYKFLYGNKALLDLYGLTEEEYRGRSFRDVGYPEWHARMHEREIDEVVRTGKPLRGKIPFQSKGGGGVYDYIFMPVFGPDGKVEAIAGTTRDVTALERTTQALRESDQRKDEFLAVLAHELRNPLAPIRNGLELLRHSNDPALVAQTHEIMSRQIEHTVHLVDDLLDLSRVNRGAIELRLEPAPLQEALDSAVQSVRQMIEQKGQQLQAARSPRPLVVKGDATRLAQVFSNLLSNAVKYTPPGGVIKVAVAADEDNVEVSVTDNGIGIKPGDQERIFEMFSQVNTQATRGEGGLGIGLHLVKRLVGMHGGRVWVTSEGLGSGSTFTVSLPLLHTTTSTTAAGQQAAEAAHTRRILIVDDNVDAAFMLSLMLKKMGHEVYATHSGEEALSVVESFAPDLVFLDIGMPGMDGHEVCRRMRAMRLTPDRCQIVALTGWGQKKDKELSISAGFDQHLVKPASRESLLAVLKLGKGK